MTMSSVSMTGRFCLFFGATTTFRSCRVKNVRLLQPIELKTWARRVQSLKWEDGTSWQDRAARRNSLFPNSKGRLNGCHHVQRRICPRDLRFRITIPVTTMATGSAHCHSSQVIASCIGQRHQIEANQEMTIRVQKTRARAVVAIISRRLDTTATPTPTKSDATTCPSAMP